jgi:hypothetical protein
VLRLTQRLLRGAIIACPEWQSGEVREKTAREAVLHGQAALAEVLRAKDSSRLRKAQYLWLCRSWGYASQVWQHKDTAHKASGTSARATAAGGDAAHPSGSGNGGASQRMTPPVHQQLLSPPITTVATDEQQPRGRGSKRRLSRPPGTGGGHTSPELQLPPPSRALGVANQELHPSLRRMLLETARSHVPSQGVRMLELAAAACASSTPMMLPRPKMLSSYLPMLTRMRQEYDLDLHAIEAQRERLAPAASASAQVWMRVCPLWERSNARIELLDGLVVKPMVEAAASIRDVAVFNSMDRAYIAAAGYDTEHTARLLSLAKSTLAHARAQSRGEFLATALCVSECMRILLDNLLTVVELRMRFMSTRTLAAYPIHSVAQQATGPAHAQSTAPVLSPGRSAALVVANHLRGGVMQTNAEAFDQEMQEVISQWKGVMTNVVHDITAEPEPSGGGNGYEAD